MKKLLFILFALTIFGCEEEYSSFQVTQIEEDRAEIAGISFSTKENEIITKLGEPDKIIDGFNDPTSLPSKELQYDGLTIYLVNGELYNLQCTSDRYILKDSVKVGDNIKKVVTVYGKTNFENNKLMYSLKGSDCYLIFRFDQDKLIEITFFFDYV